MLAFVRRLIELDKENLLMDEKDVQDQKELGQSALVGCNFETYAETESFSIGVRLLAFEGNASIDEFKSRVVPFFAYCIDLVENAVNIFHIYSKTAYGLNNDNLALAVHFHYIVIRLCHCLDPMSALECHWVSRTDELHEILSIQDKEGRFCVKLPSTL